MYNKKLANEVEYYKDKKRSEYEMCAIMDSLMNEAAVKATIEAYQYLGANKNDTGKKIMEKFYLAKEDAIAKVYKIWGN